MSMHRRDTESSHELIATASDDGSVKVFKSVYHHIAGDIDPSRYYELVSHLEPADFSNSHSLLPGFTCRTGHSGPITSLSHVSYSRKNRFLVTTSADCTAKLWMETTQVQEEEVEPPDDGTISAEVHKHEYSTCWTLCHTLPELPLSDTADLHASQDQVDHQLYHHTGNAASPQAQGQSEEVPEQHERRASGHSMPVTIACFWSSSSLFPGKANFGRVATGSDDGYVKIWKFPLPPDTDSQDIKDNRNPPDKYGPGTAVMYQDLKTPDNRGPVTSLAWNRRQDAGVKLVSGSQDSTLSVWRAKNKPDSEPLEKRKPHSKGAIWSATYDADDARILTCAADEKVKIWALSDGDMQELRKWPSPGFKAPGWQPVRASWKDEWHPSTNDVMVPCFDGTVRFLDVRQENIRQTIQAHTGCVWSAEYHKSGEYVLTASHDMSAAIWDFRSPVQPVARIRGHRGMLWGAKWSEDGQRVLTHSEDGTVKVWFVSGPSGAVAKQKHFAVLTGPVRHRTPAEKMLTHSAGVSCACFLKARAQIYDEDEFGKQNGSMRQRSTMARRSTAR